MSIQSSTPKHDISIQTVGTKFNIKFEPQDIVEVPLESSNEDDVIFEHHVTTVHYEHSDFAALSLSDNEEHHVHIGGARPTNSIFEDLKQHRNLTSVAQSDQVVPLPVTSISVPKPQQVVQDPSRQIAFPKPQSVVQNPPTPITVQQPLSVVPNPPTPISVQQPQSVVSPHLIILPPKPNSNQKFQIGIINGAATSSIRQTQILIPSTSVQQPIPIASHPQTSIRPPQSVVAHVPTTTSLSQSGQVFPSAQIPKSIRPPQSVVAHVPTITSLSQSGQVFPSAQIPKSIRPPQSVVAHVPTITSLSQSGQVFPSAQILNSICRPQSVVPRSTILTRQPQQIQRHLAAAKTPVTVQAQQQLDEDPQPIYIDDSKKKFIIVNGVLVPADLQPNIIDENEILKKLKTLPSGEQITFTAQRPQKHKYPTKWQLEAAGQHVLDSPTQQPHLIQEPSIQTAALKVPTPTQATSSASIGPPQLNEAFRGPNVPQTSGVAPPSLSVQSQIGTGQNAQSTQTNKKKRGLPRSCIPLPNMPHVAQPSISEYYQHNIPSIAAPPERPAVTQIRLPPQQTVCSSASAQPEQFLPVVDQQIERQTLTTTSIPCHLKTQTGTSMSSNLQTVIQQEQPQITPKEVALTPQQVLDLARQQKLSPAEQQRQDDLIDQFLVEQKLELKLEQQINDAQKKKDVLEQKLRAEQKERHQNLANDQKNLENVAEKQRLEGKVPMTPDQVRLLKIYGPNFNIVKQTPSEKRVELKQQHKVIEDKLKDLQKQMGIVNEQFDVLLLQIARNLVNPEVEVLLQSRHQVGQLAERYILLNPEANFVQIPQSTSVRNQSPQVQPMGHQNFAPIQPSTSIQNQTPVAQPMVHQNFAPIQPSTSVLNQPPQAQPMGHQNFAPIQPSTSIQNQPSVAQPMVHQNFAPIQPSTSIQNQTPVAQPMVHQNFAPIQPSTSIQNQTPVAQPMVHQNFAPIQPSTSVLNQPPQAQPMGHQNFAPIQSSTSIQNQPSVAQPMGHQNFASIQQSTSVQNHLPVAQPIVHQNFAPIQSSTSIQNQPSVAQPMGHQNLAPIQQSTSVQNQLSVAQPMGHQNLAPIQQSTSVQNHPPVAQPIVHQNFAPIQSSTSIQNQPSVAQPMGHQNLAPIQQSTSVQNQRSQVHQMAHQNFAPIQSSTSIQNQPSVAQPMGHQNLAPIQQSTSVQNQRPQVHQMAHQNFAPIQPSTSALNQPPQAQPMVHQNFAPIQPSTSVLNQPPQAQPMAHQNFALIPLSTLLHSPRPQIQQMAKQNNAPFPQSTSVQAQRPQVELNASQNSSPFPQSTSVQNQRPQVLLMVPQNIAPIPQSTSVRNQPPQAQPMAHQNFALIPLSSLVQAPRPQVPQIANQNSSPFPQSTSAQNQRPQVLLMVPQNIAPFPQSTSDLNQQIQTQPMAHQNFTSIQPSTSVHAQQPKVPQIANQNSSPFPPSTTFQNQRPQVQSIIWPNTAPFPEHVVVQIQQPQTPAISAFDVEQTSQQKQPQPQPGQPSVLGSFVSRLSTSQQPQMLLIPHPIRRPPTETATTMALTHGQPTQPISSASFEPPQHDDILRVQNVPQTARVAPISQTVRPQIGSQQKAPTILWPQGNFAQIAKPTVAQIPQQDEQMSQQPNVAQVQEPTMSKTQQPEVQLIDHSQPQLLTLSPVALNPQQEMIQIPGQSIIEHPDHASTSDGTSAPASMLPGVSVQPIVVTVETSGQTPINHPPDEEMPQVPLTIPQIVKCGAVVRPQVPETQSDEEARHGTRPPPNERTASPIPDRISTRLQKKSLRELHVFGDSETMPSHSSTSPSPKTKRGYSRGRFNGEPSRGIRKAPVEEIVLSDTDELPQKTSAVGIKRKPTQSSVQEAAPSRTQSPAPKRQCVPQKLVITKADADVMFNASARSDLTRRGHALRNRNIQEEGEESEIESNDEQEETEIESNVEDDESEMEFNEEEEESEIESNEEDEETEIESNYEEEESEMESNDEEEEEEIESNEEQEEDEDSDPEWNPTTTQIDRKPDKMTLHRSKPSVFAGRATRSSNSSQILSPSRTRSSSSAIASPKARKVPNEKTVTEQPQVQNKFTKSRASSKTRASSRTRNSSVNATARTDPTSKSVKPSELSKSSKVKSSSLKPTVGPPSLTVNTNAPAPSAFEVLAGLQSRINAAAVVIDEAKRDVLTMGRLVQTKAKCRFDGCNKMFNTPHLMLVHAKSAHKLKRFICNAPGCNFATNIKSVIGGHYRKHLTNQDFHCAKCPELAPCQSLKELNKHIRNVHEEGRFECLFCVYNDTTRMRVLEHIKEDHPAFGFACCFDQCTSVLPSLERLMQHEMIYHLVDKPFKCVFEIDDGEVCPFAGDAIALARTHVLAKHIGYSKFNLTGAKLSEKMQKTENRRTDKHIRLLTNTGKLVEHDFEI